MFNWFKSKPAEVFVDNTPVDTYEYYPTSHQYKLDHPKTTISLLMLDVMWGEACTFATDAYEAKVKNEGIDVNFSKASMEAEIAEIQAEQFMALCLQEEVERAETYASYDQHAHQRRLEELLGDIKQSVDRSAVAANALDFAREHPFLTGVVGGYISTTMKHK
jgi:hypothetical protein